MIRSYLYVPADRDDRFDKAVAAGPDAIILDLEDGVAEHAKAAARENASTWLAANPGEPAWVRVNNRPDLLADDLAMARDAGAAGVMMPKATLGACRRDELAGTAVVALIESATGVLDAPSMARLDHVVRLTMGDADLAADLGMHLSPDRRELDAVRTAVVVASAAAGIEAPCGPVATDLTDADGLRESTLALRRHGFGARTAIHPKQIATINECFAPAPDEVAAARRVVEAFEAATARGDGGVVLDGEYVDAAVARRARLVLGPG